MSFIPKDQLLEKLYKSPFFEELPRNVVEALYHRLTVEDYPIATEIIRKGDQGDSMFILFAGSVKIHDREVTLNVLHAGAVVGEMALIDNGSRSMSVTTLTACQMGVLSRESFFEVMKNYPDIFKYLISTLSNRLRKQNEVLLDQFRKREQELTELVRARTDELEKRNNQLSDTLEELRQSQVMIVRQAKLASLGELISDIAHEIQNPLNFVTNFSELCVELIAELKQDKNFNEDHEKLQNLIQISEKINHHGKRAESILKSMLKHHRNERRHMEQANINSICEEAVKVAMYSFKTRHADFQIAINKNLDKNIPLTELVNHDIFRLVVNLLDNALYYIRFRSEQNEKNFSPEVYLETKCANNEIVLTVRDNGTGISSEIKEKIFQPFFTTKPPGEGTGLGLSLSFDIVTSHGGTIDYSSEMGETTFVIRLPVTAGK